MLMLHDTAVMTVFLDPYLENLYLTKKQYNRKQRLKVSLIALIAEVFISYIYHFFKWSWSGVYFYSQVTTYYPSYVEIRGTSRNIFAHIICICCMVCSILIHVICISFQYNLHLLSAVVLLLDVLGSLVIKTQFSQHTLVMIKRLMFWYHQIFRKFL